MSRRVLGHGTASANETAAISGWCWRALSGDPAFRRVTQYLLPAARHLPQGNGGRERLCPCSKSSQVIVEAWGVQVQAVYSRTLMLAEVLAAPQTYTSLPGRVLGHPTLDPTGGPSPGAACFHGPDLDGLLLKEAQEGGVAGRRWGGPSSPPSSLGPLPSCSCCILSHLPKLLLTPSSKAALLPEPGTRHFSCFAFFPLHSPVAQTEIYSRPEAPAFGAGRAQGGADGPIMDRAVLPWGLALPNPIHQERLGARVSANEAAGCSPSGPPQLPLSRF